MSADVNASSARVQIAPGTPLDRAALQVLSRAQQVDGAAEADFNGVALTAFPIDGLDDVLTRYDLIRRAEQQRRELDRQRVADLSHHRRRKILLDANHLRRLLRVPDDVRIVAVQATADPAQIEVLLEADRFEPTPVDAQAPALHLRGVIYGEVYLPDWTDL